MSALRHARGFLIATILWTLLAKAGAGEPETVVRCFYDAVAQGQCAEAIALRPGYTEERCHTSLPVTRVGVTRVVSIDRLAVVQLDIGTAGTDAAGGFRGFATLTDLEGRWIIDDRSFRHGENVDDLASYMEESEHLKLREFAAGLRLPVQPPAPVVATMDPAVAPAQAKAQQPAPAARLWPPRVNDLDLGPETGAPGALTPGKHDPAPAGDLGAYLSPPLVGPDPRRGAASILDACWTPAQIKGRAEEGKIRSHLPVDESPPTRRLPLWRSPPLRTDQARSLRSVTPRGGEKLIALTFDLCEQSNDVTGYDAGVVDTLRALDARATFYAGGKWMRSHPERTMQLMADPLFEIGNHAWTHGNLRVLKGAEMKDQIHWTQAQYELLRDELLARPCAAPYAAEAALIAPVPQTFRFPYGTCNGASLQAAADAGLYPVQWNIVTGDPAKGQSASQIVKTVLSGLKPGSIVVAHGNGRGWHTAEALAVLIPELRKRGYRLVTVSELIASGTPVTTEQCFELKPGDNLRYDKLFGNGTK